jgi:hypothetical protein
MRARDPLRPLLFPRAPREQQKAPVGQAVANIRLG